MQNLDQAKKIVDVLADGAVAFDKVAQDKGSLIAKLSHLAALEPDLMSMIGVDFSQAKAEFSSLADDDKQALLDEFKAKFQLDDKAMQSKIDAGLDLGLEGTELGEKLIGFAQKVIAFSASMKAAAPVAPSA